MYSFIITFPRKSLFVCIFFVFICFLSLSQARQQKIPSTRNFIDFDVESLMPKEKGITCKHSSRAEKRQGASLEVVHRYGPCSKLNSTTPSLFETLSLDKKRVDSINARISGSSLVGKDAVLGGQSVDLTTRTTEATSPHMYIVNVGLGTPQKDLSLAMDTGSPLPWTQCKPCEGSCYKQVDPIFDPSLSSSYANVPCESFECSELAAVFRRSRECSKQNCIYNIGYGDGSSSKGYYAKERLCLTSIDCIDGFKFGCGEFNELTVSTGFAGLLGLAPGPLSLVSQAAYKYGKYFSYCLPVENHDEATGHLTLGPGGVKAKTFSFTPLNNSDGKPFYFLDLKSISVGSSILPIPPYAYAASRTVIDSGCVITRLAPSVYAALKYVFNDYLKIGSAPFNFSDFDTCYDFTNYDSTKIPGITFYFADNGLLDLTERGILYPIEGKKACLAFIPNERESDVTILGNVQHAGFDVIYDVDGGRLGFGPNGC